MNEAEFRTAWISVETRKAQAMEERNRYLGRAVEQLSRIAVQIGRRS